MEYTRTFPNRRSKIALIGAGAIGGTMAHLCSIKELGDVVLFDVMPNMPSGKALDIAELCPLTGTNISVTGSNDYSSITNSDVVIVTAGLTKAPGKKDAEWVRDDLLPFNAKIMRTVGEAIKTYCPKAFIICITNPLDVMVGVLQKASGVSNNMICGMAGALDSSRFRRFIADRLQVAPSDVHALVIGAHGDAMIPLPRYCTISGIPLNEFVNNGTITQKEVDEIVLRTRHGGKEIVQLLGQGSAFYAPATGAISMAESYLKNQKRVIPSAVHLSGQYGYSDVFVGVPCVIGNRGIEKIMELTLNESEKSELNESVEDIKNLIGKLVQMENAQ